MYSITVNTTQSLLSHIPRTHSAQCIQLQCYQKFTSSPLLSKVHTDWRSPLLSKVHKFRSPLLSTVHKFRLLSKNSLRSPLIKHVTGQFSSPLLSKVHKTGGSIVVKVHKSYLHTITENILSAVFPPPPASQDGTLQVEVQWLGDGPQKVAMVAGP